MKTYLSEIFSSIQGEGPYVGERHLFVRFCQCHWACEFCDTVLDRTKNVSVERLSGSGVLDLIPNPLSSERLVEIILEIDEKKQNRRISLTGGEPLLQANYLCNLLPRLAENDYNIYLETAGDLTEELKSIIEWVDIVAMDVKLPSVTKEGSKFSEHWEFLRICRNHKVEVFTKLILSAETDETELIEAAYGIREAGGVETLVVIQPMTKALKTDAVPSGEQLFRWQDLVAQILPNVRVIPQTHKMLEML
jgi:7-carboxy-7-deazaguanine synthase